MNREVSKWLLSGAMLSATMIGNGRPRAACRRVRRVPSAWVRLLAAWTVLLCSVLPARAGVGVRHLDAESGLRNAAVNAFAEDGRGRVWIATESGIGVFDGYHFDYYDNIGDSYGYNSFIALLFDRSIGKEGSLWCGSKAGLYRLDIHTGKFTRIDDRMQQVTAVCMAPDSSVWFADINKWIGRYNRRTCRVSYYDKTRLRGLPDDHRSIAFTRNGLLMVGHVTSGMSLVDTHTGRVVRYVHSDDNPTSFPGTSAYDFQEDRYGRIWIATNDGLTVMDRRTGRFSTFRQISPLGAGSRMHVADHVYTVRETANGYIWVGYDYGGISILNLANLDLAHPAATSLLSVLDGGVLCSGNVRRLFQDHYGNMWIGYNGYGVDIVPHVKSPIEVVPLRSAFSEASLPIFAVSRSGWVGSYNMVARYVDGAFRDRVDFSNLLTRVRTNVLCISDNGQGGILIGLNDDGLLEYSNGALRRIALGRNAVDVSGICPLPNNEYLVCTEYGASLLSHGVCQPTRRYPEIANIPLEKAVVDRQGKLWVATIGFGLYVYDRSHRLVRHLDKAAGLRSQTMTDLLMARDGSIWVATTMGLYHFPDSRQPLKMRAFLAATGLNDDQISSIAEGPRGEICVASANGISLWNGKRWRSFGRGTGATGGPFSTAAATLLPDGHIAFGNSNGLCLFSPREAEGQQSRYPVYILSTERLKDNALRLIFSCLDAAITEGMEYAYRIDGLTDDWVATGSENRVVLRGLPPGHYTVHVRAQMAGGDWSQATDAAASFDIPYPWYQQWWAYLCYAAILAAAVYYIVRRYKHRLQLCNTLALQHERIEAVQRLSAERMQFYTNITHELRTPLTLILGPLSDMAAEGDKRIKLAYDNAKRLLELVNKLLDFRKTETGNKHVVMRDGILSETVRSVAQHFSTMNGNPNVRYVVDVDEGVEARYDEEAMVTILNNLLSNAAKYTPRGSITVSLHSDGGGCVLAVADTGYGIPAQALPHIFERYYQAGGKNQAEGTGIGLALVQSLCQLQGLTIHVESTEGMGSKFTIAFPPTEKKGEAVPAGAIAEDKAEVVLVVEDNDDIRAYISSILADDYRVLTARNGREGLDMARLEIPDIIISDIMMPEMDGIEMCRQIKQDMSTCHIPVVMLTAKDTISDKEEGYEVGADSYLTKPFSARLLKTRVRNILENRRRLSLMLRQRMAGGGIPQMAPPMKAENGDTPQAEPSDASGPQLSPLDEQFITRLNKYIDEHLDDDDLDVPNLASHMAMSKSTFYRKMKGLFNISANEYVRNIRLDRCAALLRTGQHTVNEAASMTGFNNMGYFREQFKQRFGMSASEYMAKQGQA
jgi:signal transduction histidine kinase/CheY-like chemotaxis protein/ligand-binding sensor domain-containing protein/AraC-like DNA-binding protein